MKTGYKMVFSGISGGIIAILLAGLGWTIHNRVVNAHTKLATTTTSNTNAVPANNVVIRILPSSTDTEQQRQLLAAIQQIVSAHPTGYDASAFVQAAFSQVGVKLPRTIADQAQVGSVISSVQDLQSGDLVFFDLNSAGTDTGNTSSTSSASGGANGSDGSNASSASTVNSADATFVGIYLGHNEFAAVTSNGPTVVELGPPYWLGKFIYGKRVL